jgi:hypothetical protein
MIDLMNYTVRAGGKLEVNGETLYADDVMRDHMMRAVRLACEITSAKSEQVHVGEDVSIMTKDPITVSLMADIFVQLMEGVNSEDLDPENPVNALVGGVIDNYKGETGREVFINDLSVMSDLVVVAAENRILAKVIAENTDINALIGDRELIKDLVGTMTKFSFYGPTMENAFGLEFIKKHWGDKYRPVRPKPIHPSNAPKPWGN